VADIFADALEEVTADEPATARLAARTGELYAEVDKYEASLSWYRRAHAFEPESTELFEAIDRVLVALGRKEERVEHYRAGLDNVFDDEIRVRYLHVIAKLLRELGRVEDAITTYNEIVDIDEHDTPAQDALAELYDRADACILDTRPHEHFYRDIYTGLLDVVQERPLCSAYLEMALRFQEVLKDGSGGLGKGGRGIMRAMLHPLLLAAGVAEGSDSHQAAGEGEESEEDSYEGPKAYMHPKTFNVCCATQNMPAAIVLLHSETLSNDDSNEVHHQMLPIPFGGQGDGQVPAASANPSASRLTHAFAAVHEASGVPYSRMTSDRKVIDFITARINALVEDFCAS